MRKYYKILKMTTLYSVLFMLSFLSPENIDEKNMKIELDIEKAHADGTPYTGGGGCTGDAGDAACGACGTGCTDGAADGDGCNGSCTG